MTLSALKGTANVKYVISGDFEKKHRHQVVAFFSHPSSPEFTSELQWPTHINLDASSTLLLVS